MKNRKRALQFLLMAGISLLCAGCGSSQAAVSAGTTAAAGQEASVSETAIAETKEETAAESTAADTTAAETTGAETSASGESQETEPGKTLVVYFSNTGHTKAIAENIASGLSADFYEITPAEPYTSEDLNYGNSNSRSTKEMNDSSVRPGISGSVDNWDQYETIYLGYPIWWGDAPRVMATFAESYDFTGKTVIPFCTSGSSGIGSSAKGLEALAGTGNWLDGKRFGGSESQDEVMEWVNGLAES